ncbi:MAG: cupredoxin domain-containing protein [Deltaproteobacteria bacterium]|nr:MAG: cupredoxin domain-containing protein [Deltaproteobacteria bacterium]
MLQRVLPLPKLASVLAAALLTAACGSTTASTSSPGAGSGKITVNGEAANDHGTKDVSGGGSQSVEVDSFYFNPTVFTAHAGDKLTLTLSNESQTAHTFTITEQNIDKELAVGSKVTVTVTFPSSGTLLFFCRFHRSQGMLGGLKVELT